MCVMGGVGWVGGWESSSAGGSDVILVVPLSDQLEEASTRHPGRGGGGVVRPAESSG